MLAGVIKIADDYLSTGKFVCQQTAGFIKACVDVHYSIGFVAWQIVKPM